MVTKKYDHMPKRPKLADKNVQPSCNEGHALSKVSRLCDGAVYLETFLRYEWGYLVSPRLPTPAQRSCQPPCAAAIPRLASLSPKVQRVSSLQDSQEGRPTEASPGGVLCALELTRKLRLGLGLAQQLNSRLGAASVLDVVSQLSEDGDYVVLNKL
jgi:hypothetical protein